jgi:hypothetical protein
MAKFTLLEVHLEDATFTANAPYSGASGEEAADEAGDEDTDDAAAGADDSGGAGKALVGLLVVVAILALAYLGSRRLGGGEDVPDVAVEDEFET